MFKIMAIAATLLIAASSPVGSQTSPTWTYAVVAGEEGGFGWSNPVTSDHPIMVETVIRLVPGVQVGTSMARWAQFTVRLDCNAQTSTILNGRVSADDGGLIREVGPQPPSPLSEGGEVGAAGEVLCNETPFPDARTASNLAQVTRALSSASPAVLRPLLGAASGAHGASAPVAGPAAPQPSAFVREEATDRYGNDLGAREVAPRDYEACAALCAANTRCQAFTVYTPAPGDKGYCWLKHSVGPSRPAPASISGVRPGATAVAAPLTRPALPPPPRPTQPATPADCNTTATGCAYSLASHMPSSSGTFGGGHFYSSSGPWRNEIRLYSKSSNRFYRPVTACGRQLFAGPDELNKTVQGWLNPLRGALATRFSLTDVQSGAEICSWGPGQSGGSLN